MDARARRRIGVVVVALVVVLGTGSLVAARAAGPLPVLTGPPLVGPTHLRLIVGDTPPFVLNVDSQTVSPVAGVVSGPYRKPSDPQVGVVTPAVGGALVVVLRFCHGCASQTALLIRSNGSVRLIARGDNLTPARAAAAAWVLNRGRGGRCTLRLVPGTRPAVRAPCGYLQADSEAGLLVTTADRSLIVDPLSGRIRASTAGQLDPLRGNLVLESKGNPDPSALTLVNLATGSRKPLAWPSILHFGYQVFAEPNGPLVAVRFGEPAYPGPAQAVDVWLLNTTTGRFTHVPGFPAQEDLKFSHITWTSDHRLVVVSQSGGGTRTVLGVWTPGQATLPVRPVPTHGGGGYNQFVPVTY